MGERTINPQKILMIVQEKVVVRQKTEVQPSEKVTTSVSVLPKPESVEYTEAVERHNQKIEELIKKSNEWY